MLFRHLGGLNARIDIEHSFKAVHGQLLEGRFLLGISRRQTEAGRDARIVSICERIGMPQSLLASFRRILPDANHVYFGVEKDGQALLLKTYLERRDRIEQEIRGVDPAGRSFPLFTGFKWDTSAPGRQAVTRYDWYPSLPVPEMLQRLRTTIESSRHGELFDVAAGIAKRASEQLSHSDIQYLEVSESGNPRRSFDINVYKSGLRVADLFPHLLRALRHYAIAPDSFEPLYQRIKTERLGHLAGGLDREAKDFMTVYYGVKQVHSSQLGSAKVVAADRP